MSGGIEPHRALAGKGSLRATRCGWWLPCSARPLPNAKAAPRSARARRAARPSSLSALSHRLEAGAAIPLHRCRALIRSGAAAEAVYSTPRAPDPALHPGVRAGAEQRTAPARTRGTACRDMVGIYAPRHAPRRRTPGARRRAERRAWLSKQRRGCEQYRRVTQVSPQRRPAPAGPVWLRCLRPRV